MLQKEVHTLIMVNSITYAYMARDILNRMNISSSVERIPANLRKNGCGYGVKVKSTNINQIVDILKNAGVKVRDVMLI